MIANKSNLEDLAKTCKNFMVWAENATENIGRAKRAKHDTHGGAHCSCATTLKKRVPGSSPLRIAHNPTFSHQKTTKIPSKMTPNPRFASWRSGSGKRAAKKHQKTALRKPVPLWRSGNLAQEPLPEHRVYI